MHVTGEGRGDALGRPLRLPAGDGGAARTGGPEQAVRDAEPATIEVDPAVAQSALTVRIGRDGDPPRRVAELIDVKYQAQLSAAAEDALVHYLCEQGCGPHSLDELRINLPDIVGEQVPQALHRTQPGNFALNVVEKLGAVGRCRGVAEPHLQVVVAMEAPGTPMEMLQAEQQRTQEALTAKHQALDRLRAEEGLTHAAYGQAKAAVLPRLIQAFIDQIGPLFEQGGNAVAVRINDWLVDHVDDLVFNFFNEQRLAIAGKPFTVLFSSADDGFSKAICDVAPHVAARFGAEEPVLVAQLQSAYRAHQDAKHAVRQHADLTGRLGELTAVIEQLNGAEAQYRSCVRGASGEDGEVWKPQAAFRSLLNRTLAGMLTDGLRVAPLRIVEAHHYVLEFQGASIHRTSGAGGPHSEWDPTQEVRMAGVLEPATGILQLTVTALQHTVHSSSDAQRLYHRFPIGHGLQEILDHFGSAARSVRCTLRGDADLCNELRNRDDGDAQAAADALYQDSTMGAVLRGCGFQFAAIESYGVIRWERPGEGAVRL